LLTRRKSPTRSVPSMLPLGILKASTKNARTRKNRKSATGIERAESQRKPHGRRDRLLRLCSAAARCASETGGRPVPVGSSLIGGSAMPSGEDGSASECGEGAEHHRPAGVVQPFGLGGDRRRPDDSGRTIAYQQQTI